MARERTKSDVSRPGGSTPIQRLGLLIFGTAFLALFVVLALAEGVGHPSVPPGDVALVEGVPDDVGEITEATFEHELVLAAAQIEVTPVPEPGEPRYEELREIAMGSLINAVWLLGLAEEIGVTATDRELEETLQEVKDENAQTEAEFRALLKEARYTQADLEKRMELRTLEEKIQEILDKNSPTPSQSEIESYYEAGKSTLFTQGRSTSGDVEELETVDDLIESRLTARLKQEYNDGFVADFEAKWTTQTFCAPDYIIDHCANFRGDGHHPAAQPMCYEEHPIVRRPDDCPAPVAQSVPALPGSVTPLAPEGTALPQRPRPMGATADSP